MDVIQVNGLPFLTIISRTVHFGSATELAGTDMNNVVEAIKVVVGKYWYRGFTITAIVADGGFAALHDNVEFIKLDITLNITSEDEHEPYSERFNRSIKKCARMTLATTLFTMIPRRMIVEMVYLAVFWYNCTISENYISDTMGPGSIVLGRTYDYNHLCGEGTKFGEFVQKHEKSNNTMDPRTVSAIYLRPTGNTQGSFYYNSLVTGRRLHRRRCTPLPMPQEAIDRVHHIATRQKIMPGLVFTGADGTPYGQDNDDLS